MVYSQNIFAVETNIDPTAAKIQIIVDGSIAMGQHDPQNIRLAILQELVKVLPSNAVVGLWLFAKQAQTIIPMSKFGESWRSKVAELVPELLDTKEAYVNLAEAIEIATARWTEPTAIPRQILLITDGLLNVADNTQENAEAKAHIINSLVPYLQKNNIKLDIISISAAAADDFLQQLADGTKGIYQKVTQADNLTWLLLKIFEQPIQIAPAKLEQLSAEVMPIEEHKIVIEQAVDEINLVVFKAKSTDMLALRTPAGKVLDQHSNNKAIHWHSAKVGDFITITNPELGTWTLLGNLEPKNKFIIMDGLELDVTPLPADIFVGESFMLTACIVNNGELITNKEFLASLAFNTIVEPSMLELRQYSYPINKHNKASYNFELGPFTKVINNLMIVETQVFGKTFQKSKQQKFRVLPVPIKIKTAIQVDNHGQQKINIIAIPDGKVLDLKNLNLQVIITDKQGETFTANMVQKQNKWEFSIMPKITGTYYVAQIKLFGETILGRYVELVTEPLTIMVPQITLPDPVIVKVFEKVKQQQVTRQQQVENKQSSAAKAANNKSSQQNKNNSTIGFASIISLSIGLLIGNVLIIVGVMLAMRKLKHQQQNKLAKVLAKFHGE